MGNKPSLEFNFQPEAKLYKMSSTSKSKIRLTESDAFDLIKNNASFYKTLIHLAELIPDYQEKAIKSNILCLNYMEQTIKLCLLGFDALQNQYFVDTSLFSPTMSNPSRLKLSLVSKPNTILEAIIHLIHKQQLLDLMNNENNLSQILSKMTGNLKEIAHYQGNDIESEIRLLVSKIYDDSNIELFKRIQK